jgi:hypothetical protein
VVTPGELVRFEAKYVVDPNSGCWLWTASLNVRGYGQMYAGGRLVLAHRLAFAHFNGSIADGHLVCHRCDVRCCVNPAHLWLGTPAANMADMDAKGRRVPGAVRGEDNPVAKLTEGQVREIRALHADGVALRAIARRYPVSRVAIRNVVAGRTWGHVA